MASFHSVAAASRPGVDAGGQRNQKRKLDLSLSSTSSTGSSATGNRRVAAFQAPPEDILMSSASPSPESTANMSLEAKQRVGAIDTMLPVKSLSADLAAAEIDRGLHSHSKDAKGTKGRRRERSNRRSSRSRGSGANHKARARSRQGGAGEGGALPSSTGEDEQGEQLQRQQLVQQQPEHGGTGREDIMSEDLQRQMRSMLSLQAQLRQSTLNIDNLQFALHHAKKNGTMEGASESAVAAKIRGLEQQLQIQMRIRAQVQAKLQVHLSQYNASESIASALGVNVGKGEVQNEMQAQNQAQQPQALPLAHLKAVGTGTGFPAIGERNMALPMHTPTPQDQVADQLLRPVDDSIDLSRLPGVHFLTHRRDWLEEESEDTDAEEDGNGSGEDTRGTNAVQRKEERERKQRLANTPKPWGRKTPRSGRPVTADSNARPPRSASLWRPVAALATASSSSTSSSSSSSSSSSFSLSSSATSLVCLPCPFVSSRYRTLSEGLFHSMVQKERELMRTFHPSYLAPEQVKGQPIDVPVPSSNSRWQPELNRRMRAILFDWMMEVCQEYMLKRETCHYSMHYVDKYLSRVRGVRKSELQLVGVTALFVASKVEEIYPPRGIDFALTTDGAFSVEQIYATEYNLLTALDWELVPTTALSWANYYMQALGHARSASSSSSSSPSSLSSTTTSQAATAALVPSRGSAFTIARRPLHATRAQAQALRGRNYARARAFVSDDEFSSSDDEPWGVDAEADDVSDAMVEPSGNESFSGYGCDDIELELEDSFPFTDDDEEDDGDEDDDDDDEEEDDVDDDDNLDNEVEDCAQVGEEDIDLAFTEADGGYEREDEGDGEDDDDSTAPAVARPARSIEHVGRCNSMPALEESMPVLASANDSIGSGAFSKRSVSSQEVQSRGRGGLLRAQMQLATAAAAARQRSRQPLRARRRSNSACSVLGTGGAALRLVGGGRTGSGGGRASASDTVPPSSSLGRKRNAEEFLLGSDSSPPSGAPGSHQGPTHGLKRSRSSLTSTRTSFASSSASLALSTQGGVGGGRGSLASFSATLRVSTSPGSAAPVAAAAAAASAAWLGASGSAEAKLDGSGLGVSAGGKRTLGDRSGMQGQPRRSLRRRGAASARQRVHRHSSAPGPAAAAGTALATSAPATSASLAASMAGARTRDEKQRQSQERRRRRRQLRRRLRKQGKGKARGGLGHAVETARAHTAAAAAVVAASSSLSGVARTSAGMAGNDASAATSDSASGSVSVATATRHHRARGRRRRFMRARRTTSEGFRAAPRAFNAKAKELTRQQQRLQRQQELQSYPPPAPRLGHFGMGSTKSLPVPVFERVMDVIDLCMLDYASLCYPPSVLAAAALYVVLPQLGSASTADVLRMSRIPEGDEQLQRCVMWVQSMAADFPTNSQPHSRVSTFSNEIPQADWYTMQRHHPGLLKHYNNTQAERARRKRERAEAEAARRRERQQKEREEEERRRKEQQLRQQQQHRRLQRQEPAETQLVMSPMLQSFFVKHCGGATTVTLSPSLKGAAPGLAPGGPPHGMPMLALGARAQAAAAPGADVVVAGVRAMAVEETRSRGRVGEQGHGCSSDDGNRMDCGGNVSVVLTSESPDFDEASASAAALPSVQTKSHGHANANASAFTHMTTTRAAARRRQRQSPKIDGESAELGQAPGTSGLSGHLNSSNSAASSEMEVDSLGSVQVSGLTDTAVELESHETLL